MKPTKAELEGRLEKVSQYLLESREHWHVLAHFMGGLKATVSCEYEVTPEKLTRMLELAVASSKGESK